MILPTYAYAVRVAWSSVRLPMACSNTTTSFRRLSTPHKASAPMMALSCVVTKPLWLSPRSWYASWARNVKATVIPMQLPVQVHPCSRSFKKHKFTSNERQAYARGDLSTPKLCRTPCSRESKPVRLLKRADVQRQSRPWLLTVKNLMSSKTHLRPRPKPHLSLTTHTKPTRTIRAQTLIQ